MTTQSTVFDTLKDQFGDSLEDASLPQKLILMEATAQSMRMGLGLDSALGNLDYAGVDEDDIEGFEALLDSGGSTDFQDVNEGLRVMTFLATGIVEDYSILAANERLGN